MRKTWVFILLALTLCCLCACGTARRTPLEPAADPTPVAGEEQEASLAGQEGQKEDDTMEAENRRMVADALGVEETDRSIRFVMSALKTVGAGRIQTATATEDKGETLLDVLAEDGTEYRIYLSGSGSLEAVKNCTTGEWPIRSVK